MAKTEKDYGQLAAKIVELVGGKDNIAHAAHCLTRLRITPKDTSLVKLDEIKKLGVIGAQAVGDQVQVIIGNDIDLVYDAFLNASGVAREAAIDENLDPELQKKKGIKEILGSIFPAIVACVFPILPALLACGLLQAVMMLLINLHIVSPDSPTVATFTWVYNVAYYFLPVLVAYAASRRFNVKAAMAILMGLILVYPDFVELCKQGAGATIPQPGGPPTIIPGTGNAGFLFGIPIYPATYSNTIIPAILVVFVMSYVEKVLNKFIPKVVRFIFVPLRRKALRSICRLPDHAVQHAVWQGISPDLLRGLSVHRHHRHALQPDGCRNGDRRKIRKEPDHPSGRFPVPVYAGCRMSGCRSYSEECGTQIPCLLMRILGCDPGHFRTGHVRYHVQVQDTFVCRNDRLRRRRYRLCLDECRFLCRRSAEHLHLPGLHQSGSCT